MKMLFFVSFCLVAILGCSQMSTQKAEFGFIGGDVWIRSIGSDNQLHKGESSNIDVSIPQNIYPVNVGYTSTGLFAGHSIIIKEVSGSLFIEEAVNRNQGIDIESVLSKLYTPGDPFLEKE